MRRFDLLQLLLAATINQRKFTLPFVVAAEQCLANKNAVCTLINCSLNPDMENLAIADPLFREAVNYIDAGDLTALELLLQQNPALAAQRLHLPDGGYFKDPYLLWFVAGNPIRNGKLPANIVRITKLLLEFVCSNAGDTYQQQINYALGLIATGRIPRESGMQIELIDLLIDSGASPGNPHGALANGNMDAATQLIRRGAKPTLTTAICLEWIDQVPRLLKEATASERETALVAAAFYGKPESIQLLLEEGVNVNAYLNATSGFHTHATALHQAVYSGSLEAVKLLVEAGADLQARDKVYDGTPVDWAAHMQRNIEAPVAREKYEAIELYLDSLAK